jgi:hypothetical protein
MSRADEYSYKVRRLARPGVSRRRVAPLLGDSRLSTLRIDAIRWAIRTNQVTFPSQVPTFGRHDRADLQWRFAQLYFVHGWNCGGIAAKYGLIHQRVRQILNTWKRRAVEMGYIQFIPPAEALGAALMPVSSSNLHNAPLSLLDQPAPQAMFPRSVDATENISQR